MKAFPLTRRRLLALIGPGVLAVAAARAGDGPRGALVMFRRRGCPWCDAWDSEVRPGYVASEAGRRLPVRDLDLDRDRDHGIALVRPVRFTPTFVVVETAPGGGLAGATELLRIEGYPGAEFFWGYIDAFLDDWPDG